MTPGSAADPWAVCEGAHQDANRKVVEGFEDEEKTKHQQGRQGKNSVNGFWLPLLLSPPEPLAIHAAVKCSQLGGYHRILIPPTIRELMVAAARCCSSLER